MPVKCEEVVESWGNSKPASNHRNSLRTDGLKLWSYELMIGDTCEETGVKVLRDYTAKGKWGKKSQTTSCHVGLARSTADLVD